MDLSFEDNMHEVFDQRNSSTFCHYICMPKEVCEQCIGNVRRHELEIFDVKKEAKIIH